jgi:hypothetical protein
MYAKANNDNSLTLRLEPFLVAGKEPEELLVGPSRAFLGQHVSAFWYGHHSCRWNEFASLRRPEDQPIPPTGKDKYWQLKASKRAFGHGTPGDSVQACATGPDELVELCGCPVFVDVAVSRAAGCREGQAKNQRNGSSCQQSRDDPTRDSWCEQLHRTKQRLSTETDSADKRQSLEAFVAAQRELQTERATQGVAHEAEPANSHGVRYAENRVAQRTGRISRLVDGLFTQSVPGKIHRDGAVAVLGEGWKRLGERVHRRAPSMNEQHRLVAWGSALEDANGESVIQSDVSNPHSGDAGRVHPLGRQSARARGL